jgi:Xaa-Pro aminopeptidase
MSQIKNKKEISNIEKACRITDEIFSKIISDFSFVTERELALWIRREIKSRGLREAFPPIVTSSSRAGNEIHPKYTNEPMRGFVIIDFGVRINGYCSDMTRTIFVGIPTKRDRELYKLLLSSKLNGEKLVRDGAQCATADAVARKTLGSYKKYFIHTLGHGVGKRIHELPRIYFKRTEAIFKENMVVTVEPGIYIPNKLGIRIEDTYVVTKLRAKALTKSTQKLLIFPKRQ